jgi:hypothetical protein
VGLLLGGKTDSTSRARVAITVLAAAQIPARLIRGVNLVDRERQAQILPWLEVHDGERWLYFDRPMVPRACRTISDPGGAARIPV